MNKRGQVTAVLLYGVFVCYIILLMKIVFFSRISPLELFDNHRAFTRSINLIPFYSIMQLISGSSADGKAFAFGNVVGNIVLFIPLGLYLSLFQKQKRMMTTLLVLFIASLSVEIIQGLLGIGTADIDDVILNCLGGVIGILGYRLLLLLFRDDKKVRTEIAILSAVVGLPVIFYLLFMIKMRF